MELPRNNLVDLGKYVAAIMIVAIHTSLFSDVNATLSFTVVNVICRTAVPFFAVCTGYFLLRKCEVAEVLVKSEHNLRVFCEQWKKLILLYGAWTLLYLPYSIPMWIEIGWFSPFAFVDYAVGALTKGSHYHFWYLWGMIYTLPVFYLVLRALPAKYWDVAIVILWTMKAIVYGYSGLLPARLSSVINLLRTVETPVCLLALLLLGAKIACQTTRRVRFVKTGLWISLTGLCVEAFALRALGQESVSYIFCTLPLAYYLFQYVLRAEIPVQDKLARNLGSVSIFVYCVHPMVVESTADYISSRTVHFLVAAVVSTVMGIAFNLMKKCYIRKRERKCFN